MTLTNPLALLWGLLAIPIVILYLRRIRLDRQVVATSMFWEQALAEQPRRSVWQRRRQHVSLAVQLTLLLLMVVALADPRVAGPRRLVLAIDNSRSMNAIDVEPTRLARAKDLAQRIVAGLRPCDQAAVLTAGGVGVRCNFTSNQTALLDAVASVPPGEGATRMEDAVALARRMLADRSGGEIIVLCDGCFPAAVDLAAAEDVEMICVGRRPANVAITRLTARTVLADPRRCQVLAEVRNFSDQPTRRRLELLLNDRPADRLSVQLDADGRWLRVVEFEAAGPGRVTAGLNPNDDYPVDDRASCVVANVPGGRPDVVSPAERAGDAFTGAAESDLRAPDNVGTQLPAVVSRRPGAPPWLMLIGLALVALALEWCLYQRRWIC